MVLEDQGLEGLTLQAVAAAVDVRAPSLYKRIAGRDDLIRRISTQVATELGGTLGAAGSTGDAGADIRAMAHATRAFARSHPQAFRLLFAPLPEAWRADADVNTRMSAPILDAVAALVGEEASLPAARTVVAWVSGFVGMEQAGAFRLGGDLEQAFDYGIEALLAGLSGGPSPRTPADQPRTATRPSRRTRMSA
jgi:AcrR family transcriptional regulator